MCTCISSPFGYRVHPVPHAVRTHTGIDYAAPTNMPIKAATNGEVTFKGWKDGHDNIVMIRRVNGMETLYGHMSALSPADGRVRADEVTSFMGIAGRSIGPHLRYGVRANGQPVNSTTVAPPTPKLTPVNMIALRKQQEDANTMLSAIRSLPVSVAQLD